MGSATLDDRCITNRSSGASVETFSNGCSNHLINSAIATCAATNRKRLRPYSA